MMTGIDMLRRTFSSASCSLRIISAGYGVIDEPRSIVPYEATFHVKPLDWVRKRAGQLGIPQAIRTAIEGFDCVIFLLGKEYLVSIHPPLQPLDSYSSRLTAMCRSQKERQSCLPEGPNCVTARDTLPSRASYSSISQPDCAAIPTRGSRC